MINNEKNAIKLLKNAAFHLGYVIKMAEGKRNCIEVIQESRLVQNYLRLADEEIMSNHLKSCAIRLLSGRNKEQQLQEILLIFKKGYR